MAIYPLASDEATSQVLISYPAGWLRTLTAASAKIALAMLERSSSARFASILEQLSIANSSSGLASAAR